MAGKITTSVSWCQPTGKSPVIAGRYFKTMFNILLAIWKGRNKNYFSQIYEDKPNIGFSSTVLHYTYKDSTMFLYKPVMGSPNINDKI